MQKRDIYKILISTTLLLGLFSIIMSKPAITGSAFGIISRYSDISNIIGVILIVVSISLLVSRPSDVGGLERTILIPSNAVVKRIRETVPSGEVTLVLDTSMLQSYDMKSLGSMLANMLDQYKDVFVPESVLRELPKEVRDLVENKSKRIDGVDEKYRKIARGLLDHTKKAEIYRVLSPLVEDRSRVKGLTYQEMRRISEMSSNLRKILMREGIRFKDASAQPGAAFAVIRDSLKFCAVSETDVDVLAYALCLEDRGRTVVIGQKDAHLEEGVQVFNKTMRTTSNLPLYTINNYAQ